jgi:hypothetical protein
MQTNPDLLNSPVKRAKKQAAMAKVLNGRTTFDLDGSRAFR